MSEEKINHHKIAKRTLFSLLFVEVFFFILNSWSNIKQSFSGDMPKLSEWLDQGFKLSTVISISILGIFFYYRDFTSQKELIENQRKLKEKHENWLKAE